MLEAWGIAKKPFPDSAAGLNHGKWGKRNSGVDIGFAETRGERKGASLNTNSERH